MMATWWVYCKELMDALRDRRTLIVVLLSSVAIGPLVLVLLSSFIGGAEARAEQSVVMLAGGEHAPTLVNYLQRQTVNIKTAPIDFEDLLRRSKLAEPVIVIPADFEAALATGEVPMVEVVSSAVNTRAQSGLRRAVAALRGFSQEQGSLRLVARGVAPGIMEVLEIQERDLANPQSRASQFTSMLPFFVLMAVLYGAMTAALDTTSGERERGSLEPLLMTRASRDALVIGKWAAVATLGMIIALLSCLSFLPAQYLLRSETLAAMFQFGAREVLYFLALLAPLAAALSAVMMAIAIRTKTFKEAQANTTVVILAVSLLPMVQVFNQEGESPWHLWVPALGQISLMNRVLRGELVPTMDVLIPLAACMLITGLCLAFVARMLRVAAIR